MKKIVMAVMAVIPVNGTLFAGAVDDLQGTVKMETKNISMPAPVPEPDSAAAGDPGLMRDSARPLVPGPQAVSPDTDRAQGEERLVLAVTELSAEETNNGGGSDFFKVYRHRVQLHGNPVRSLRPGESVTLEFESTFKCNLMGDFDKKAHTLTSLIVSYRPCVPHPENQPYERYEPKRLDCKTGDTIIMLHAPYPQRSFPGDDVPFAAISRTSGAETLCPVAASIPAGKPIHVQPCHAGSTAVILGESDKLGVAENWTIARQFYTGPLTGFPPGVNPETYFAYFTFDLTFSRLP